MAGADPASIELLVLDVDGVLTDGRVIYDSNGCEAKTFHVRDGAGLKYWGRAGFRAALLTGRESPMVLRRGAELGIELIRQKALKKLPVLEEILAETGVAPERTAYMGDDLVDIPPMRAVGLGVTVADAVDEVKQLADWIAPQPGGAGAARWAIERLLKASGKWDFIMQRYR